MLLPTMEVSTMLTLVYLRNAVLLTKQTYSDWREVQEQFFDYKTSLGPFNSAELFEFLDDEYPDGLFVRAHVEAFIASSAALMSGGNDRATLTGPGWPLSHPS
jgi:hypothetical protein